MKLKKKSLLILVIVLLIVFAFYPYRQAEPIRYVDRDTGQIKTEQVVAGQWLFWLYNNPLGKLSLEAIVKRKIVSEWYGRRMDSPASAKKIVPFIKKYHINLSNCQKQHFNTFNDFFTRKLKKDARPIDTAANVLVSPADGKLLAYKDIKNKNFVVKGKQFNVYGFLQNDSLAAMYANGSLLLFRLCPTDYHRFHFPTDGTISPLTKIKGYYYSVNPIAIKKNIEIFCENKREYVVLSTLKFGNVVMAEVGATMVGGIIQTYKGDKAVKGAEKGYFKFGGSSVILLFGKGKIIIDYDLLANTRKHLETQIKMGERVGMAY